MSARPFSRLTWGAAFLVLTVLPFVPLRYAPEFWAEVPTWAQWVAYGCSAVSLLGIVSLIFTADYGEEPAPADQ